MRIFLSLLMLCLIGIQPVLAAQQPSAEDAQYGEWMTYYYLHKNPAKMNDFLKWVQASQILEKNKGAKQPLAAFMSVVFANNPQQVQSWVKSTQFTNKTKEAVEYTLWLSGNGKLIAETFKETPDYIKSNPVPLNNLTLKQAGDLDMMWGAFLASGDTTYVKKIIDILDENVPLTGEKTLDMATRGSAEWSLGSNMMQHELVNRLIRKEISVRTGTVKKKLEEIVARNEQNAKPFPNKDGDFSAMLVVTDEKALAEYEKPSSEGMWFKEASKAKRGDVLAIKIVFAGMELSDDLNADVTYDLKILNPADKIYDNADLKNQEALKAKIPMRFRIFDNRSFMKIQFEPKDKLGKYTIIATLYDNVGKKVIPLIKEVELRQ